MLAGSIALRSPRQPPTVTPPSLPAAARPEAVATPPAAPAAVAPPPAALLHHRAPSGAGLGSSRPLCAGRTACPLQQADGRAVWGQRDRWRWLAVLRAPALAPAAAITYPLPSEPATETRALTASAPTHTSEPRKLGPTRVMCRGVDSEAQRPRQVRRRRPQRAEQAQHRRHRPQQLHWQRQQEHRSPGPALSLSCL